MIDTHKAVTLMHRLHFWAELRKASRFGLEEGTVGKGISLKEGWPAR